MARLCAFLVTLCLSSLIAPVVAQSSRSAPDATRPANPNSKPVSAAAERAARERRAKAVSLLVTLTEDVRNFRDERLRARTLARIADALWDADPEQARTLFRKAWDAAELADRESDQKLQEEILQQKSKTGGGFAVNLPPNVRREVLGLAARHDRALGEELLDKLKAQKQEAANAAATTRVNSSNSSQAISQRLGLAQELLDSGDIDRALQFADPTLGVVSMETVNFLSNLREKNPLAADQRYARMLATTNGNLQADANTASLLSSYIFTPHLFVIFSSGGVSSSQQSATLTPADVTPELRAAFLQTAAAILFRPMPPPDQDQSSAGLEGKYLVLKRLMPLFEQFAPPNIVETARGQLEVLSAAVVESVRQRDDEWVRRGLKPEKPVEDEDQSFSERIDHAKTSAERDELYLQWAFKALHRGDVKAREYISKIDESELRKQAQAYLDPALAMNLVEKKRIEQALEIARIGELTHVQRAWVLSQCAKLLAKTARERSLMLLEDAAAEARRIEVSDPDRPRALTAVATVLRPIDAPHSWDSAFEAVKAANSAEGFTGEDGELVLRFQGKGYSSINNSDVPDFDLAGLFSALAKDDYDRAVELTRGFTGQAPRATATIAIARAVLNEKKK